MKNRATLKEIFTGRHFFVPEYQRAYTWESKAQNRSAKTQTDVFLDDLLAHMASGAHAPYYLGHILFERAEKDTFGIIDGQQRLTTVMLLLYALRDVLKATGAEALPRMPFPDSFKMVSYDSQFFVDYFATGQKTATPVFATNSARRLWECFCYFTAKLRALPAESLSVLADTVCNAMCTTHVVTQHTEAIQMFLFQNNRGKKPSSLEVIKAQFMLFAHLYGANARAALVDELNSRFSAIYRYANTIENWMDEDTVLAHTVRIHSNSLWGEEALGYVTKKLDTDQERIQFIQDVTLLLEQNFAHLEQFFIQDNTIQNLSIHSLISLNRFSVVLPFILKSYSFSLSLADKNALCAKLASLALRHALIGTRAELESRLNDVFQSFTSEQKDIQPILVRIDELKNTPDTSWWWAYWNNAALERAVQGKIPTPLARFLLWQYEVHLAQTASTPGYVPMRFDDISYPELEHIAPQTEPQGGGPQNGYPAYDERFTAQYLNCLGNYLLASKQHNASLGNAPFRIKCAKYKPLYQQREVASMVYPDGDWTIAAIAARKEKLVAYITSTF